MSTCFVRTIRHQKPASSRATSSLVPSLRMTAKGASKTALALIAAVALRSADASCRRQSVWSASWSGGSPRPSCAHGLGVVMRQKAL